MSSTAKYNRQAATRPRQRVENYNNNINPYLKEQNTQSKRYQSTQPTRKTSVSPAKHILFQKQFQNEQKGTNPQPIIIHSNNTQTTNNNITIMNNQSSYNPQTNDMRNITSNVLNQQQDPQCIYIPNKQNTQVTSQNSETDYKRFDNFNNTVGVTNNPMQNGNGAFVDNSHTNGINGRKSSSVKRRNLSSNTNYNTVQNNNTENAQTLQPNSKLRISQQTPLRNSQQFNKQQSKDQDGVKILELQKTEYLYNGKQQNKDAYINNNVQNPQVLRVYQQNQTQNTPKKNSTQYGRKMNTNQTPSSRQQNYNNNPQIQNKGYQVNFTNMANQMLGNHNNYGNQFNGQPRLHKRRNTDQVDIQPKALYNVKQNQNQNQAYRPNQYGTLRESQRAQASTSQETYEGKRMSTSQNDNLTQNTNESRQSDAIDMQFNGIKQQQQYPYRTQQNQKNGVKVNMQKTNPVLRQRGQTLQPSSQQTLDVNNSNNQLFQQQQQQKYNGYNTKTLATRRETVDQVQTLNTQQQSQRQISESNNNPTTQDRLQMKKELLQENSNKQYNLHQRNTSMDTYTAKRKVTMSQFNMSIKIGTGSYAVVKLGVDKVTGQKVAIKIYDKQIFEDKCKLKNVKREIQILSKLKHPNIIKLFHVIETEKEVNLVMEYVGLTSLFSYLKQNSQKRLPEHIVRKIFRQIASGLDYIHEKNITHRDIKLENLLLSDNTNDVKIIDFGFSIYTPPDRKLTSFCGTPSYMAPEIINQNEYSGPPVDIWCLGVLLFVLMCGQFPFKGKDEKELYQRITECNVETPGHVPLGAKHLLKKILCVEPHKRPTAQDIINDPWIRGDYESDHYYSENSQEQ